MNKFDWMDSPGNFYDRCGWLGKWVVGVFLVLACCLAAGVIIGVIT